MGVRWVKAVEEHDRLWEETVLRSSGSGVYAPEASPRMKKGKKAEGQSIVLHAVFLLTFFRQSLGEVTC